MPSIVSRLFKAIITLQDILGDMKTDIAALRRRTDAATKALRPRRGVAIGAVELPGRAGPIQAEWLVPEGASRDRALLYLHGGAWRVGSPLSHRAFASQLAHECAVPVLTIAYRLAPEDPFPAALEDCASAWDWLLAQGIAPGRMVVAGDSAGGNLALALLVALRDEGKPLPAGGLALSPVTDLALTGESQRSRKSVDPVFHKVGLGPMVADYLGGADPRHPHASPLYADLAGLPPLLLIVGDDEVLRDDSTRFVEKAQAAGVLARLSLWPGMFHVFPIFSPLFSEAKAATAEAAEFVRETLGSGLPGQGWSSRSTI